MIVTLCDDVPQLLVCVHVKNVAKFVCLVADLCVCVFIYIYISLQVYIYILVAT